MATKNENKLRETRAILADFGIRVRPLQCPKVEIQSPDIEKVSIFAADYISRTHRGMVAVEDSGLFVKALGGFPGPYSSYVHKTIGPNGILRLLERIRQRSAYFQTSIALSKSGHTLRVFTGRVRGRISWTKRGDNGFGFDSIFIPVGTVMTFGEMSDTQKNKRSHRFRGFRRLAKWYLSP